MGSRVAAFPNPNPAQGQIVAAGSCLSHADERRLGNAALGTPAPANAEELAGTAGEEKRVCGTAGKRGDRIKRTDFN